MECVLLRTFYLSLKIKYSSFSLGHSLQDLYRADGDQIQARQRADVVQIDPICDMNIFYQYNTLGKIVENGKV